MTYAADIAIALVRTLERAAFQDDLALAGYAANAKFWADEVRHALDVLERYESRADSFAAARHEAAAQANVESEPLEPSMTAGDLDRIAKRLRAVATRFYRLCQKRMERAKVLEIEQLLGIRIAVRKNLD